MVTPRSAVRWAGPTGDSPSVSQTPRMRADTATVRMGPQPGPQDQTLDAVPGLKLTENRSGRWIDLLKADASQWQVKDNSGRTAVFDLDAAGNLHKTTNAEGKTTTFDYDSSRRLTKITTAEKGGEANPVHSCSRARRPAFVIDDPARRPSHRGYCGSLGRGWLRQ